VHLGQPTQEAKRQTHFSQKFHLVNSTVLKKCINVFETCPFMCFPVSRLFWVSSLAYPKLLGTKGYVVVVVVVVKRV
jgi:hypothetical protein